MRTKGSPNQWIQGTFRVLPTGSALSFSRYVSLATVDPLYETVFLSASN